MTYLPINQLDLTNRGYKDIDFILVSGDAYIDHPSFGTAIIGRVLEAHGYRILIMAQPDWHDDAILKQVPYPKLGFLVLQVILIRW